MKLEVLVGREVSLDKESLRQNDEVGKEGSERG